MKTLLILGASTGGTMVANKMAQHLDPAEWRISLVDRDEPITTGDSLYGIAANPTAASLCKELETFLH